ncbi:carotenoid cleavage dioxygenase 7, chloroplastic-like [Syzygium oleosum]|uniref:carotenoid cleavage dioxygenase 7, chloroplastic-like n=1 Tax=Syzygium oleosum TaxID=219896 RepID=UPI0024BB8C8A|nr:carotenoid cleavage dioxygenase 7, chloroplastic-like [Syzygium oleosum]
MQANTICHISPTKLLPISTWHDRIPAGRALAATGQAPRAISISTSESRSSGVSAAEVEEDRVAAFWDYQSLFVSPQSETAEPVLLRLVDGAVPSDFPSGTYYLIGPGLFADDHGSTVHPLDGHGYLRGFVFGGAPENKEVKFMARYVKTEAQVEEHDPASNTWRFTHRGPFSVLKGGRKVGNTKVMKNVANTSVVKWGGKLLCLWEGGDPYEIEPRSLNTVGKLEMIDGHGEPQHSEGHGVGDVWDVAASILKPILYGVFKMPAKRMLSHYKVDARNDRLLTLSCNAEDMLLPRSNFTFYEFDSDFKLLQKKEFNIPDHLMIHDWAFTDTHYILFGNRIKLDISGSISAVCGISPMISALSVDPGKSTSPIYLLPRSQDESQKGRDWRSAIEVPAQLWLMHFGNAFEAVDDEEGTREIRFQACVCSYEWFNFHKLFGYNWQSSRLDPSIMNVKQDGKALLPHLVQVSIDVNAEGDCQKCSVESLNNWTRPTDFPVINPDFSGRKNKYIYGGTTSGTRPALPHFPFDSVAKLNMSDKSSSTWSTGNRRFIGEPIFVPKGTGEEDDGHILVVEYAVSIQRCYLVILNPKRIGEADALVARLEVPKELNFPLGFHGFWDVDS